MTDNKISEQEKFFKNKNRWNKIKGLGCLALVILIVFSLVNSQNSTNKPQKVDISTVASSSSVASKLPETSKPAQTAFKIGDIVKLNDTQLAVTAVDSCTSQYGKPQAGNKIVIIDVTEENIGSEPLPYTAMSYKLQDDQNFTYDWRLSVCKQPAFSGGTLQPSEKVRGYLHFEIPENNKPTKLIFTENLFSTDQIIININ